jgi:hypothetical protein
MAKGRADRISFDDAEWRAFIGDLEKRGADYTAALRVFRAYMAAEVDTMWDVLSSGGGTHRGRRWRPFAPQYTRQDGTQVPIYGGLVKVRGKGRVKGRLRPSGRGRYDASSQLMQDTGTLRQRATVGTFRQTKTSLSFGTPTSVRYASRQHQLRPYLFFNRRGGRNDIARLKKILQNHLLD